MTPMLAVDHCPGSASPAVAKRNRSGPVTGFSNRPPSDLMLLGKRRRGAEAWQVGRKQRMASPSKASGLGSSGSWRWQWAMAATLSFRPCIDFDRGGAAPWFASLRFASLRRGGAVLVPPEVIPVDDRRRNGLPWSPRGPRLVRCLSVTCALRPGLDAPPLEVASTQPPTASPAREQCGR